MAQQRLWKVVSEEPIGLDIFYPEGALQRLVPGWLKLDDDSATGTMPKVSESQAIMMARGGQRIGMRYSFPSEAVSKSSEYYQGLEHDGPYFTLGMDEMKKFSAWHPPRRFFAKVMFVFHRDEDDAKAR